MCGIVGVIAKNGTLNSSKDEDVFEELLYVDGLRGMDSTGCFSVTKKNQIHITKQAIDPGIFFRTRSYKSFKDTIRNSNIVIGHNRKATQGEIVSRNAHPFIDKKIVLVHNGFIANSECIDKESVVDSQSIITALADHPDEPVKGLDRLWGAWAIVWYNYGTKKLYLARNNQRPLAIAHTPDRIYIASEGDMLEWMLNKHHVNHQQPIELSPDSLYTVSVSPFDMDVKKLPLQPVSSSIIHIPTWARPNEYPEGDMGVVNDPDLSASFELEEREEPTVPQQPASIMDVKEMQKLYPADSEALFQCNGFVELANGFRQINGRVWIPGREAMPAVMHIELSKRDNEDYLNQKIPLICKIGAVSSRGNANLRYLLNSLWKDSLSTKSWNSVYIPHEEWRWLVQNIKCGKCAQALMPGSVDCTIVDREDGHGNKNLWGKYKITCADCVAKSHAKSIPNRSTPLTRELGVTDENNSEYGG